MRNKLTYIILSIPISFIILFLSCNIFTKLNESEWENGIHKDTDELVLVSYITTSITPTDMEISPDGKFLYCVDMTTSFFYYKIDEDGLLTDPKNPTAPNFPSIINISPNNKFFYFIDDYNNICMGIRDQQTGNILDVTADYISGNLSNMTISPDGKHAYIADNSLIYLSYIDQNTGRLSTPISTTMGGSSIVISSSGMHAYIISGSTEFASCRRSPDTGLLWSPNNDPGYTTLTKSVISPDEKNVYLFETMDSYTFHKDRNTGILTYIDSLSGYTVTDALVSPDGKYLYVTDSTGGKIYLFNRNSQNGALTYYREYNDSMTIINIPNKIATSPDGKYIYISGSSRILIYKIDN